MSDSKIIQPGDLGGPSVGREIAAGADQLMSALIQRFPRLGDPAAKGFTIRITLSNGIAFEIGGSMVKRSEFGIGRLPPEGGAIP